MNKVRIEVDESLKVVLEDVKREVSKLLQNKYHIEEVDIYGNLASRILAARYNHDKKIEFEIEKINSKKGVLKVV